jgi:hypothetical protein
MSRRLAPGGPTAPIQPASASVFGSFATTSGDRAYRSMSSNSANGFGTMRRAMKLPTI